MLKRPGVEFVLVALGMAAIAAAIFGLGFRVRGGELVALIVGPALITAGINFLRNRRPAG